MSDRSTDQAREDAIVRRFVDGGTTDIAELQRALRVVLKERDTLLLVRDSLDSDVATLHARLLRAEEALQDIDSIASQAVRTTHAYADASLFLSRVRVAVRAALSPKGQE